ncbi:unnamed protein product [Anisakis simplex]|uniref:Acyltransferase n=1 Tax=Anisakis simplex TaxID=6269 RepID=A0A0M3J376_ANISI|nr:unnamed protein product [Anisakis simplex]VDK19437.1 unnamed protein product [Anisakis simplex]
MYLNAVYTKPWSRAPAFLIGLLFSFIFVSDSKLDKIISIVILFLFVIVGLFIVFAIFPFALNMKASSQFLMALYASVHRSVWCAIICAMIYVCYRKSGREFGAFLEWRIFNPLSKLTYLVFVLSEPVSLFLFSSLHRPVYATHWSTFYIALGTIVLSYIVAIALDVLIARPMRNLLIFVIGPYLNENKSSYEKACTNGKEPH